jgi:HNH endonuclease
VRALINSLFVLGAIISKLFHGLPLRENAGALKSRVLELSSVIDPVERERRILIYRRTTPLFGTVQPAALLKDAERFGHILHHFAEGIFKPQWATHALSISSMLSSPYTDQIDYLSDRSWTMAYSPKAGGLDVAANRALIACMDDQQPLLVFRQRSAKKSRTGSYYLIAGLGMVERFEVAEQVFRIRGLHAEEVSRYLSGNDELADDLLETALRLESLEEWRATVQESRAIYQVSRQKREAAFRDVVLSNYGFTCAATGQRFRHGNTIEAEAAHIIGKEVLGTDDPRNGLALSRTAHWAFDQGLFTVSDQYELIVHKDAKVADHALFPLLEATGKPLLLPSEPLYRPHPEALEWHRKERFGAFLRPENTS